MIRGASAIKGLAALLSAAAAIAAPAPAAGQEASASSIEASVSSEAPAAGEAAGVLPAVGEQASIPPVAPPEPAPVAEGEPPAEAAAVPPQLSAALVEEGAPAAAVEGVRGDLRRRAMRAPRKSAFATAEQRKGTKPPGHCALRPDPDGCRQRVVDRQRGALCDGAPDPATCQQEFDQHPCVVDDGSQACFDYLAEFPCIDDAASFECARWRSMRAVYCATQADNAFCSGAGSPGAETFGPGGSQTQLAGVFDRGVSGDLVLVDSERKPRGRLPKTGLDPGGLAVLGLLLLVIGIASGRAGKLAGSGARLDQDGSSGPALDSLRRG